VASADAQLARGELTFPKHVVSLVRRAANEHQQALSRASDAVKHAVKAGEVLCLACETCRAGEWQTLLERHFPGSMRTAQKYMRLAKHFQLLRAEGPNALSSQNEASKALTAIMRGDDHTTPSGD
jgi:hypothetical protein